MWNSAILIGAEVTCGELRKNHYKPIWENVTVAFGIAASDDICLRENEPISSEDDVR